MGQPAAGFLKACETAAALRRFRDDGLTPQLLSTRLRFTDRARALLQAAILQGNGSIAYSVGLKFLSLPVSVLLLCISLCITHLQ
jgi:hypothetical protein